MQKLHNAHILLLAKKDNVYTCSCSRAVAAQLDSRTSGTYLILLKDNRYPVEADTNLVHQRSNGSHQGVQNSPSCHMSQGCGRADAHIIGGAVRMLRIGFVTCLIGERSIGSVKPIFKRQTSTR